MNLHENPSASSRSLDPFLIAASPAAAFPSVAGLDDFLAVPPIPAEPAAPESEAAVQPAPAPHQLPTVAALTSATPNFVPSEAIRAADLPILTSFPPQTAAPSAVVDSLGGDDSSLIAPPDVVFPNDADPGASLASLVTAGVDEGGGGDVLSALAANPLADGLLADPSALLSAVPLATPAVDDGGSEDRFDPWSAGSSWSNRAAAVSRFGPGGLNAGPSGAGSLDDWARGDDRASAGCEALDRIEGRLSQAVAKLEEAVAALSAPGPSPLGSRPRGFRGRIDA
ncbi:MAG: hypothetical protein P4L85_19800 [Paludisphaera borealis]|uniref:hypothetical protein n=1 Tax=Paludisphaera borealis TaxID=1387353 RepID=UPI0028489339|nr:hypothetical protein [Paludisphaera borealis]MDR3621605.1 hypothetical protein [Paludisphaera borealis]